ncbi:photosynthetic reaction center cytochrome PufC [Tropicibacter sp. S64]|uniref:photosynthetic reaction center cytochrome PufC n=1 Tax=Tropicibacter sp. S64 TaxID=3415122 RepID=UPI003C7BBF44
MLPKWFNQWNRDNPTDVERPAIIFGTIGVAVIAVVALVMLGQPYRTESLQTGPRGTGMMVTKFAASATTPDPTIAGFLESTSAPVVPAAGAQLAGDARETVPAGLEGLTVENYDRLLTAMRAWTGIPDLFENPDSYQTTVGTIMIGMTRNLNENWDGHVNANGAAGVTCYTCHRGEPVPSDVWFDAAPLKAAQGWAATQNHVTPLTSYTSLPTDALRAYLVDYGTIAVHDLESRVAGVPGQDGYPGIQNAERTYALMNYFANSLNVNCTLCHNTRAFYDGGQVTPQWATASLGIAMVQELNNDYLVSLEGLLPAERMGPMGDGPKAACATCHKGYQRPLQGLNVIADWPELATSGEVQYE